MMKIISLLSISVCFIACGLYTIKDGKRVSLTEPTAEGYTQIMESWENASELQLIKQWGVPYQTYEVEDQKYLLYKEENNFTLNGNYFHFYCDTTFTIENGIITYWKYSGNNCKAIYKENN